MERAPNRPLSSRDALTIRRIVRVNHAGEYGAIRIYSAQIAVSARRHNAIAEILSDMLAHEKKHCAAFLAAMPQRQSRPCRLMALWSWGGSLLGLVTALMGKHAIWVCTAAVEAAVHRHLDDQLHFLEIRDPALRDVILSIREDELSHLHQAQAQIISTSLPTRFLHRVISDATEIVIWLSTWGDSTRMARALRADKEGSAV